jgi:hypothetical protein
MPLYPPIARAAVNVTTSPSSAPIRRRSRASLREFPNIALPSVPPQTVASINGVH